MGKLAERLEAGALDGDLARLYGKNAVPEARTRLRGVIEGYRREFGGEPEAFYSAPGRTELGGNHTDHQHGAVLAASVNLDILAAVGRTDTGRARVKSEGYPVNAAELSDLSPRREEEGKSTGLIRGVAEAFSKRGCVIGGGFDAFAVTTVPGGSGLSSSAAFEVLMGVIMNDLWYDNRATPVELAQIGQYAENMYFGKPCGLMDQTASSVGGVVSIDFMDPSAPLVRPLSLDLEKEGYALCIIDSGAGHADLTGEYAAITDELKSVSRQFGKTVLRDVPEEEFTAAIPELRKHCGDRAVLRAMHFYDDNERALQEARAVESGNFAEFLRLVNESGNSSAANLQNVVPTGAVEHQELMVTIALAKKLLAGAGAVRVHGGGFGGTAQAFVPLEVLDRFKTGIENVLGSGSCHVLSIRPVGGVKIGG